MEDKSGKSIAAVLFLIAGISIGTADRCSTGGTDGGAFQRAAGLMTDDSAEDGTAEGTGGGATLGVRTGGCGAVGKGDCHDGTGKGCERVFHW